jgi:hypothetical protein
MRNKVGVHGPDVLGEGEVGEPVLTGHAEVGVAIAGKFRTAKPLVIGERPTDVRTVLQVFALETGHGTFLDVLTGDRLVVQTSGMFAHAPYSPTCPIATNPSSQSWTSARRMSAEARWDSVRPALHAGENHTAVGHTERYTLGGKYSHFTHLGSLVQSQYRPPFAVARRCPFRTTKPQTIGAFAQPHRIAHSGLFGSSFVTDQV